MFRRYNQYGFPMGLDVRNPTQPSAQPHNGEDEETPLQNLQKRKSSEANTKKSKLAKSASQEIASPQTPPITPIERNSLASQNSMQLIDLMLGSMNNSPQYHSPIQFPSPISPPGASPYSQYADYQHELSDPLKIKEKILASSIEKQQGNKKFLITEEIRKTQARLKNLVEENNIPINTVFKYSNRKRYNAKLVDPSSIQDLQTFKQMHGYKVLIDDLEFLLLELTHKNPQNPKAQHLKTFLQKIQDYQEGTSVSPEEIMLNSGNRSETFHAFCSRYCDNRKSNLREQLFFNYESEFQTAKIINMRNETFSTFIRDLHRLKFLAEQSNSSQSNYYKDLITAAYQYNLKTRIQGPIRLTKSVQHDYSNYGMQNNNSDLKCDSIISHYYEYRDKFLTWHQGLIERTRTLPYSSYPSTFFGNNASASVVDLTTPVVDDQDAPPQEMNIADVYSGQMEILTDDALDIWLSMQKNS